MRLVVGTDVAGRADVLHVAADAGEVLLQDREHAAGRVAVVVERVVGEIVTDQRGYDRSLRQFAAHRERSFAVLIAVDVVHGRPVEDRIRLPYDRRCRE